MKYAAVFGIDHGVSMGFGFKYPDHTERTETIEAECPEEAFYSAIKMAGNFCDEYLSNPETQKTDVSINKITDSEGQLLNQREIVPEKYRKYIDENGIFHGCLTTDAKILIEGLRMSKEERLLRQNSSN